MSDEPDVPAEQETEPPAEPQVEEQDVSEVDEGIEAQAAPEEGQTLPPTLAAAGLVGVVGQVSGNYAVPSGTSFWVTPGQAYAVSPDDAAALAEMGVAVTISEPVSVEE